MRIPFKEDDIRAMLLMLCMIGFIARSTGAASLNFGNMQIEGAGTISPDSTSMDIHLEITNINEPQSSASLAIPSLPSATLPAAVHSAIQATKPHDAWYQQDEPSFGAETGEEFLKSALNSHNKFRAIHNSPPLKLNIQMSKEAEEFAKKLFERGTKNQPMVHEDQLVLQKENEGENLAAGGGSLGGLTAHGAVKNWYNEVCTYNWGKGSYEPQAAHFMQVIWKGIKELGIGKAEGKKNGRSYTYIVARYKPAITYDTLKNVLEGKFNPSYCRNKPASSLSDTTPMNRVSSKVRPQLTGHFPKQTRYFPKKPANLIQPLRTGQPIGRLNSKKPGMANPPSIFKPNDGPYGKGYQKTTNRYPYGQGYPQNDKLSYYAGNSWGTKNGARRPMVSSEYYPKQAEVLEEFVEGDDPEKAKYEQITSNDNGHGVNGRFTQSLIPVMNSVDAEIDDDDDPSEDELATKTNVPKHSN